MTETRPPFDDDAYELTTPQAAAAPLLIDSPHSGRVYPADFKTVELAT